MSSKSSTLFLLLDSYFPFIFSNGLSSGLFLFLFFCISISWLYIFSPDQADEGTFVKTSPYVCFARLVTSLHLARRFLRSSPLTFCLFLTRLKHRVSHLFSQIMASDYLASDYLAVQPGFYEPVRPNNFSARLFLETM